MISGSFSANYLIVNLDACPPATVPRSSLGLLLVDRYHETSQLLQSHDLTPCYYVSLYIYGCRHGYRRIWLIVFPRRITVNT